jgi:hypothetical protein
MATINYNKTIYSGISFPPRKDGNAGFFAISTDLELIKESVYIILNTRKGEMVMYPEFGSAAMDSLFENMDTNSQAILCQQIKKDIETFEKRITVKSVAAYSKDNTRIIIVTALVNVTGQETTLEYNLAA